jgi:glycerate 2-kinase
MSKSPTQVMLDIFEASIAAADPALVIPPNLPSMPRGRTIVIGAGKAAARMAHAVEVSWEGPLTGMVVTRYGYEVQCSKIEIIQASHPVPDQQSVHAASRMLGFLENLNEEDLVICLISGGASSLLVSPAPGISLKDKQTVNRALLSCGAPINEMNIVRKQLSRIKGGRLALAAYPAKIVTLIVSDVVGDDPSIIGSGPTVPDRSTTEDARAICARYNIDLPDTVKDWLSGGHEAIPTADHLVFNFTETHVIGSSRLAITAAENAAKFAGFDVVNLSDSIEGSAQIIGRSHATEFRNIITKRNNPMQPCLMLSGGELTVEVKGSGQGGPNQEYAISAAIELSDLADVHILSADTDGIDGPTDAAGALITPKELLNDPSLMFDARNSLANNDAYSFLDKYGGLLKTGPTFTNVNDLRLIAFIPRDGAVRQNEKVSDRPNL